MFPRWFFLLFLAFLGYLLFMGTEPVQAPRTAQEAAPPIRAQTYPTLSRMTSADYWKRSLNPDYARQVNCALADVAGGLNLKWVDEQLGSGAPAACGDSVAVEITVWNAAGKAAYTGSTELTLGTRQVAAGLDAGLTGLRPGARRTLILPPAALTRAKKSTAPKALLAALPAGKTAIVTVVRAR